MIATVMLIPEPNTYKQVRYFLIELIVTLFYLELNFVFKDIRFKISNYGDSLLVLQNPHISK